MAFSKSAQARPIALSVHPALRQDKRNQPTMLIRLGYDIQFDLPFDVPMVALLHVHPSRTKDLLEPDEIQTEPKIDVTSYYDTFGNRCARFVAPHGHFRLSSSSLIQDSGDVDPADWSARESSVAELP